MARGDFRFLNSNFFGSLLAVSENFTNFAFVKSDLDIITHQFNLYKSSGVATRG